MSDLVERSRFLASGQDDPHSVTITELCDKIEALEAALTLAGNRLHRLVLDQPMGSRSRDEVAEWAQDARAALKGRCDCYVCRQARGE